MSDSVGNTTAVAGRHHGFSAYPKLKPSGVEWLGDVPEHWEVTALCRLTSSIKASNVDKHIRNNELPVRLCNYRDVYYNDGIDSTIRYMRGSATAKQVECLQLRKGDVLITKDSEVHDDIGVPSLVLEDVPDLVAGYHLALLRPDLRYLYGPYLFRALQSDIALLQFTHRAQGVTRYGLTYPGIRSVRLPVPPIIEQRAIANYLDRETAKIDALIARNEVLIKRLKEHRTALISRTVTSGLPPAECWKAGIDPHPKLKPSGVEWLGDVPEHWEIVQLGRIGHLFKGSGGTMSDDVTKGVPCVRYGDLYTTYHYHVKYSHRFVSEQTSKVYTPIRFGDVLFAGSGETIEEIGKSAVNLLQEDACCGGDVIVLRPTRIFDPVYLGYVAGSPHASWQKACTGRGVTVMHTYATDLRKVAVPFPPVAVQQVIARYLDRETARLDRVGELARYENDLLREYRTRLISDVVTGKVDVRDLADTNV